MEPIDPIYGTTTLLLIAAAAVGLLGMDEKTTLKTWTVMETTLGVSAFAIAGVLWAVL